MAKEADKVAVVFRPFGAESLNGSRRRLTSLIRLFVHRFSSEVRFWPRTWLPLARSWFPESDRELEGKSSQIVQGGEPISFRHFAS